MILQRYTHKFIQIIVIGTVVLSGCSGAPTPNSSAAHPTTSRATCPTTTASPTNSGPVRVSAKGASLRIANDGTPRIFYGAVLQNTSEHLFAGQVRVRIAFKDARGKRILLTREGVQTTFVMHSAKLAPGERFGLGGNLAVVLGNDSTAPEAVTVDTKIITQWWVDACRFSMRRVVVNPTSVTTKDDTAIFELDVTIPSACPFEKLPRSAQLYAVYRDQSDRVIGGDQLRIDSQKAPSTAATHPQPVLAIGYMVEQGDPDRTEVFADLSCVDTSGQARPQ